MISFKNNDSLLQVKLEQYCMIQIMKILIRLILVDNEYDLPDQNR